MDLIFVLLTQLINLTTSSIDFEVDRSRRLLPRLQPGRTQFAKESRVLRRIQERDPDWKIRVLLDGEFTGIELDPWIVLQYVRVEFRVDNDVLCVDGVRENRGSDVLLRLRFFGCMRNFYWNSRPVESIDRSRLYIGCKVEESPRKNHKHIEEDKIEMEGNGNKSQPQPPNRTATTQQATRLSGGDESSTTNVVGDSFVQGIVFAFCFMVFILIKFLHLSM